MRISNSLIEPKNVIPSGFTTIHSVAKHQKTVERDPFGAIKIISKKSLSAEKNLS